MKHICHITVEPRKGQDQKTRWHVQQSRPYPSLTSSPMLQWSNAGSLIPRHGSHEPPSIGQEFRCFLLRQDLDVSKATGNRDDFAGFSPGLVYDENGNRVMQPENPGTIYLRGKSLGEMLVTFDANPEYPDITVRGYGIRPTPSEREWIMRNILPALRQYIQDSADSLKQEALEGLRKDVLDRVGIHRMELSVLEAQMKGILASL